MDGKQQLNQLDPKLQEAYNRVMGTNVPPPAPGSPAPQPPANPVTQVPTEPKPPVAPPQPAPVVPQVPNKPPPVPKQDNFAQTVPVAQVFTPTPSGAPQAAVSGFVAGGAEVAAPAVKKSGISPAILVLAAIVFFIVYTLVWIKVFNLSLPFLPS